MNSMRFLVEAKQHAVISSELNAKITSLPYLDGEGFRKGDIIAAFDCRLFKASVLTEGATLKGARKSLENIKRLSKLGSASDLEIALAVADVERATGLYNQAKVSESKCKIPAPFSGKVVERHARLHEVITQGEPVLEIINHEELELKIVIPSLWLKWLKVGTPLQVKVDETGHMFQARVERISAKVDPVSQSLKVIAKPVDRQDGLMPGMSGNALFVQPLE
ncbi:efflux RND transporter periplasmic adaptor subunit [Terasakiella sp. SH-1]|uniref:efflux RND transporter periplasmic adaptor subunit n=1 Tax=Terasakiella sp. SH-1 TaxID=2560057 RepID=UPI0014322412|nr:efflux RND transporter periplasmic adaptor subunit [Terasakiella sp. SH-1]